MSAEGSTRLNNSGNSCKACHFWLDAYLKFKSAVKNLKFKFK